MAPARTIRKDFPDLGDDVWVEIRNPRMLPLDRTRPKRMPKTNSDGAVDLDDARGLGYALIASLITGWHVWDATVDDEVWLEDITSDTVRRVPSPVELWIAEQLTAAGRPS